jgi:hypothetical protein
MRGGDIIEKQQQKLQSSIKDEYKKESHTAHEM